jgi:hypothetical protein
VDEILDLRSFQIREKFRGVVDRRKKKCLRQGGVVTNGPPGRQQKSNAMVCKSKVALACSLENYDGKHISMQLLPKQLHFMKMQSGHSSQ